MAIPFDYTKNFTSIDMRKEPEQYQVGKGEQGVLSVEPYKSELLPVWRFRTEAIAKESAKALYGRYNEYKDAGDFVGMDMARKFVQMGYTRARRYANHKSGQKYSNQDKPDAPADIPPSPPYKTAANRAHHIKSRTKKVLPRDPDPEKAAAAAVFYAYWQRIENDTLYTTLRQRHKDKYG
jgi:hypothetical protein